MALLAKSEIQFQRNCFKSLIHLEWMVWIILSILLSNINAQDLISKEYQVKAVFLFNFTQFVEWPQEALLDSSFVIGIYGKDPYGKFLDETIKNEKVDNRSLSVKRFKNLSEINECHILFVSETEQNRLNNILKFLRDKNTLTVSDQMDFAKKGGMIQFVNEENKIRLHINIDAVKNANLNISSKLLRLAQIVNTLKG